MALHDVLTRSALGQYEVLSPLGVGGMGEVYRAQDTRLQRGSFRNVVSLTTYMVDMTQIEAYREIRLEYLN